MRKIGFALFVLILILLGIYLLHPFLLEGMARCLIIQDKIQPVDLIIVLGGDDSGERLAHAVDLYHKGYAKKLLMSGGPLAWRLTHAEWMQKHALALGVPAQALLLEDRSRSTIDNAKLTLPIAKKNNFKSIILVTSPTHSRRAKRVFRKVYSKEDIRVFSHPVPLQKSAFRLSGWWTRHEDTQRVIWEYVSSVYYFLKGY